MLKNELTPSGTDDNLVQPVPENPYTALLQEYIMTVQTTYGNDQYITMFNEAYMNANNNYMARYEAEPTISYDQVLYEEFKKIVESGVYRPL